MIFLWDENLPHTLVRKGDYHAKQFGERLTDTELWDIALEKGMNIITRDADFYQRLLVTGPPPKVIWIRLGNKRRAELEKHIQKLLPEISMLLEQYALIEVYEDRLEVLSL